MASRILKIVESGKHNTQSLYASDKAGSRKEEKKCEQVKEKIGI